MSVGLFAGGLQKLGSKVVIDDIGFNTTYQDYCDNSYYVWRCLAGGYQGGFSQVLIADKKTGFSKPLRCNEYQNYLDGKL